MNYTRSKTITSANDIRLPILNGMYKFGYANSYVLIGFTELA